MDSQNILWNLFESFRMDFQLGILAYALCLLVLPPGGQTVMGRQLEACILQLY